MSKLKNKKAIIISLLVIFIFLFLAVIINFKKLKASVNEDMLGFKDEKLYYCILADKIEDFETDSIDGYLEFYDRMYDKYENFPSFDYIYNLLGAGTEAETEMEMLKQIDIKLTEEDLNKVTRLRCDIEIEDYTGIEKLISLETLYLYGNIDKLDLSNNNNLKHIETEYSEEQRTINQLILPKNLETLDIEKYDINNLELKGSKALKSLTINNSYITEFALPDDTYLDNFYIYSTNFNTFDFSKIKKANSVSITGEGKFLDLSNIETVSSILINGDIEELKLPNKINQLNNLSLDNNSYLNELDLSNYNIIGTLSINTSNLKKIMFKANSNYNMIQLINCKLDELDTSNINVSSLIFNGSMLAGKPRIKVVKTKSYPTGVYSNLKEIYLDDGSYIKFKDKVIHQDNFIIFKDKNVTANDILNASDFIEKDGFEFKICTQTHCEFGSLVSDMTTKIKTIPGSYLNIYKDNTLIISYTLDVFDNEYFDDYNLYKSVVESNNLGKYTAVDLTEEQLENLTELSFSSYNDIVSYRGFEKLIGLKRLSMTRAQNFPIEILNNLKLLEIIDFSNVTFDTLDTTKFQNLYGLTLTNVDIKKLVVNNNPNLDYISVNYSVFGEIKLFENNVNNIVKRVNIQNSNISELDVSALLNLKRLNLEYNQLKNLDLSNNVLLTEFDGSYNNLEDINLEKNVNLSYLDLAYNNFSKINIKNNMLLKNLYLNYNKLEEVDFSNNNNLETLRYDENKNIKKIIGTKNIPLDGEYVFDFPYLEEIDLTGCENIPMLGILSNELKSLDLTDMKNLVLLLTTSQKIKEIKGIEGAQQLATLFLPYTKIDSLDLSSLSNLQTLNAQYTNLSRNSINMLSGENKKLNLKLKLPQQMTLEHYNEDDYFAEYNIENNLITANNPGQTVITSYFPSYHFYLDVLSKEGIKTTVNVFDIKSSKFLINKEYKYIFDENNESSKVLNRYIKVYGEDVSKEIENNKLFMYSNDKKIFTFDILKITSEDYKIDNKKNVITYSGTFDINKISVVNGTLNKIDNELQLICNDNIVRTYKLEKK